MRAFASCDLRYLLPTHRKSPADIGFCFFFFLFHRGISVALIQLLLGLSLSDHRSDRCPAFLFFSPSLSFFCSGCLYSSVLAPGRVFVCRSDLQPRKSPSRRALPLTTTKSARLDTVATTCPDWHCSPSWLTQLLHNLRAATPPPSS
ncbi:hypothetical protein J3F83DRAFT_81412 [Trichoderma novae-zelandiae]